MPRDVTVRETLQQDQKKKGAMTLDPEFCWRCFFLAGVECGSIESCQWRRMELPRLDFQIPLCGLIGPTKPGV
jgi:hypothetical protein